MTDRERESKFQQKEGEQRKAGQETREEMKEEAQEKGQKDRILVVVSAGHLAVRMLRYS